MRLTRCALPLAAVAALGLVSGAALAQATTEDEQILEESDTTEPAPPPPEESDDDLDEQVFYSGMGVSQVDSGFTNLGEAINLDITLGFRIPTVKWFGIEIDIGQTIIPGENETEEQSGFDDGNCLINPPNEFPPGCTPSSSAGSPENVSRDRDEFGMQALGISAVLKSTGRFYVMGRYGYRYVATSIDELNEERSGNGMGFGVGYRWGRGLSGVELTYKELSEEIEAIGLVFFARINRP